MHRGPYICKKTGKCVMLDTHSFWRDMVYDVWQLAGSVLTTHFSHHQSSYMSKHFSALCTKVKLKLTLDTEQPSFCPPTSFPAHGSLNLQPSIFSHLIYTHFLPLNGAGRPLSNTYLTQQSFVFALIQQRGTLFVPILMPIF